MYSVPVPTFASHFRSSSATNSGPLSDSPIQHHIRQRFDHFIPSQPSRHADRQTLPRVFVDQRQHPQRSPVMRHCAHEIVTPHMVRSFRSQPKARSVVQPQPASRPLFLRHFQPFPPPDPLHSILAYMPTAIPQQSGDPPVAVPSVCAGQRHDLARQRIFVASINHFVALCSSPLPQQPAGMPLGNPIILACLPDRATPPLRA